MPIDLLGLVPLDPPPPPPGGGFFESSGEECLRQRVSTPIRCRDGMET